MVYLSMLRCGGWWSGLNVWDVEGYGCGWQSKNDDQHVFLFYGMVLTR